MQHGILLRHGFRAMGTDVELLLEAEPGPEAERAFAAAQALFEQLEALLSRFRESSELSALNRNGTIEASQDTFRVVELALAARELTGGRFDPTAHDAVAAAGYDRSFELVARSGAAGGPAGARCGGRVELDRPRRRIRLAPGVRLDLGGIGKGYAVDRAAELLALAGPCLVNAGGDIAVRGGAWPVGLETPAGPLTLELSAGGLATSGRDRRRWERDGRERHHLIDPSTGEPSASDLLHVTVIAGSATDAEVLAKSLFLAGGQRAAREADALGVPTALVTGDGRTLLAGGLA